MSADPHRPVCDLLGGAPHVDIDDVGALCLGDARAFRHPLRFAAGELNHVNIHATAFAAQRWPRVRPAPVLHTRSFPKPPGLPRGVQQAAGTAHR